MISNSPQQKVVGAVIPPDSLTAIVQSEVLIAIATRYDELIVFGRQVGRGSPASGIVPLKVAVDNGAILRLLA